MYFAQGAYGWPMYVMTHSTTGVCQLCSELRCCWPCCHRKTDPAEIIKDNCCFCNYAALKKMVSLGEVEVVYATFHVDIGETPFFVAVDYSRSKIIVSIRGTLSMQDVLTDLNAEGECLPLNPPREDWIGHKGMVQAAVYIKNKLDEENLIQRALNHNLERETQNFGIVLVGHSLGAGTAAILAILLKQEYADLHCYSYSPPGGLLRYIISAFLCGSPYVLSFPLSFSQLVCQRLSIVSNSLHQLWWERMLYRVSVYIRWRH